MATMPPETDPAMGAEAAPPAAPVKTICISQQADGTYSVYEEGPESAEPAPMPGQEPAEKAAPPEAKTASSLDEALQLAAQLLQSDGRTPEEQMMAGYSRGAPAPRPSPKQVFGG